MTRPLHLLVIDGYTRAARDELEAGGATIAATLYETMLLHHAPTGSTVDILFPSDPGTEMPIGTALANYDGLAWTGCSLCITDETPEVQSQVDLQKKAFAPGMLNLASAIG